MAETIHSVMVNKRQRGVFLCSWREDSNGEEEWEAFSTLKAAQDWCLGMIQASCDAPARLRWERDDNVWFARHEHVEEDDNV